MNDDELKALWQEQPLREVEISPMQALAAMDSKTAWLRRCLERRDFRELVGCAYIVVVFAVLYFTLYRTVVSRVGVLVVIGSSIFIGCRLVYARRANPPAGPGATIVESLRAELNAVRTQSRLLDSVFWWYLFPLSVGLFLCTWGTRGGIFYKISYSLVVAGVYAFIYRLNKRARVKELLPVEAELESLLHTAETGEPLNQEEVANLRPIIVSLAAAEKVKPVEFKVSFWQIAVYGEIGFIGIWLFLMLSWSPAQAGSKQQTQARSELVFNFQATNRFSTTARKLVEYVNKGDYGAAQELFGAGMSAVLPPEKATNYFSGLKTMYGGVEKVEGPTGKGYRGWPGFRLDCERGEVMMSLALDNQDKISGLYIAPIEKNSARSVDSMIARIGSWKRLLLIIPFFLCGLIYSWLIQKTTKRAVGISALGVHLLRGQRLVLWEEIKEIRTMRVLNFVNLWLIDERGQKSLMQWTPLERHSELRGAVERFAPVEHPIRGFLKMLK